jgi:hypothetical protein
MSGVTDLANERLQVSAVDQQEAHMDRMLTEAELDAVAGGARDNSCFTVADIVVCLPPPPPPPPPPTH